MGKSSDSKYSGSYHDIINRLIENDFSNLFLSIITKN